MDLHATPSPACAFARLHPLTVEKLLGSLVVGGQTVRDALEVDF